MPRRYLFHRHPLELWLSWGWDQLGLGFAHGKCMRFPRRLEFILAFSIRLRFRVELYPDIQIVARAS